MPYGDSEHYDFIADVGGQLLRIQCKTATALNNGEGIDIDCRMVHNRGNRKKVVGLYEKTDFDYFATWYKGQTYLVPIHECNSRKILRFVPPRVNISRSNCAADYELEKMIKKIKEANKNETD